MAEARTYWETIKVEGGELLEKVKTLIHEGNVRRIVIRQGDRSIAEFPLTVGLVGTVGAPTNTPRDEQCESSSVSSNGSSVPSNGISTRGTPPARGRVCARVRVRLGDPSDRIAERLGQLREALEAGQARRHAAASIRR